MRIARIELHGFRGFRDYVDIPIPDGFLVIQGLNGAGKSTICDAVEFALTGTISKYQIEKAAKESVADYIWWRGDGIPKDRFVRVHLFATEEPLVITRTPSGCDKSDAEIVSYLCDVQCPDNALQTLMETTLIRDESISSLSLDITETERYQRVQRSLGAVFTRDFATRADQIAKKADEIHRANASREETIRKELNALLASASEARSALVSDQDLVKADDELRKTIPGAPSSPTELIPFARGWLASLQANSQARLTAIGQIKLLRAEVALLNTPEFRAQLSQVEATLSAAREIATKAASEIEAARRELDVQREADATAAAFAELVAHGEEVGLQEGHCPLCDSAVTDEKFAAALVSARERLSSRGSGAVAAEKRLSDANARFNAASEQVSLAERSVAGLNARLSSLSSLNSQISLIQETQNISEDEIATEGYAQSLADSVRERTLFVEQRIRVVEASRAVGRVRELDERIRSLRADGERASAAVGKSQRALTTAKLVQHSITRTAGEMLDERLAQISPLLSELFLRLRPHGDWRNIEYRIRGDVRRFLSLAVGDDLNPQFVFSSGQRRVTGLAFLLSVHLSRHWCKLRALLLDDPVQHIDDYRAFNLVEVVAAIRRDGRQVIVAVEDAALASLLCRRLGTVDGQNGALLTVESGPQGVGRIKANDAVLAGAVRVLDRLPPATISASSSA